VALSSKPAAAIPPVVNIPPELIRNKLRDEDKKKVTARIQWWRDQITILHSNADVTEARQALLKDYRRVPHPIYRSTFAEICTTKLMGLLTGKTIKPDDPLRTVKRINTAIAFSKMPVPASLPALDYMISCHNQAMRYLGWKGYMSMRKSLLRDQGRQEKFIAIVKKGLETETSPLILEEIFSIMDLADSEDLSSSLRQAVQKTFLQVLLTSWDSRRRQVLAADNADMISALRTGITALTGMGKGLKADAVVLQLILNMADSAASAFGETIAREAKIAEQIKNETDEDKLKELRSTQSQVQAVKTSCQALLTECEDALNELTGGKATHLKNALTDPDEKVGDRAAAVKTAVLSWADSMVKSGVKEPQPPVAKKAPAKPVETEKPVPATKPAPTTKPSPAESVE